MKCGQRGDISRNGDKLPKIKFRYPFTSFDQSAFHSSISAAHECVRFAEDRAKSTPFPQRVGIFASPLRRSIDKNFRVLSSKCSIRQKKVREALCSRRTKFFNVPTTSAYKLNCCSLRFFLL